MWKNRPNLSRPGKRSPPFPAVFGFWLPVSRFPVFGSPFPAFLGRILRSGFPLSALGFPPSALGSRLLVLGSRPLVLRSWLPVPGFSRSHSTPPVCPRSDLHIFRSCRLHLRLVHPLIYPPPSRRRFFICPKRLRYRPVTHYAVRPALSLPRSAVLSCFASCVFCCSVPQCCPYRSATHYVAPFCRPLVPSRLRPTAVLPLSSP